MYLNSPAAYILVRGNRLPRAILKQFGTQNAWNNDEFKHLVDPLLIHGELLTENNSRLRETASLLFDRFIALRNHELSKLSALVACQRQLLAPALTMSPYSYQMSGVDS
jgi:hypothetical protein